MSMPMLFGPYGGSRRPENLRTCGANAIWFHDFNDRYFDVCRQHGLSACVEFPTFRADFNQRPDLVPIGVDGRPIRYGQLVQGVCLSRRDFLQEIEQKLREGVSTYKPAGIWLDYLTYGGWFETPTPDLQDNCFCRDCIAHFCETAGVDADTPAQILADHADAWVRHKCRRIAQLADRFVQIIRQRLPDCIIGAYMCPWRPEEFDGALTRIFGQDYALLAKCIDVFTPLIYVSKCGRKPDWGCEFLRTCGDFVPVDRRMQLILDVLDFPASLEAVAACPRPSWGIQLFGGASIFDDPDKARLFQRAVERIEQASA